VGSAIIHLKSSSVAFILYGERDGRYGRTVRLGRQPRQSPVVRRRRAIRTVRDGHPAQQGDPMRKHRCRAAIAGFCRWIKLRYRSGVPISGVKVVCRS